jgi:hypothetical protein
MIPLGSNVIQVSTPLGVKRGGGAAAWWDGAYAAYSPDTAASLAASYTDLTGNGRNLPGTGVPPTHTPGTGWIFNGTTQYLVTNILPSVDQTWSAIVEFSGLVTGAVASIVFGYSKSASTFYIAPHLAATGKHRYASGDAQSVFDTGAAVLSGIMAVAGTKAYLDGNPDGDIPSVPGTGAADAIFIGARSLNGSPSNYCNITISKIGFWSSTLTPADIAAKTALI